jgi:hypothetical protein
MPKPKERNQIIEDIHIKLGHFSEKRTLVEICKKYYWHNHVEEVSKVVRTCYQC